MLSIIELTPLLRANPTLRPFQVVVTDKPVSPQRLGVHVCACLTTDDSMSGASVSDVNDRLAALELRVQQQEDELTVMKAALADVLRRLDASEISAASSTKKQHGGKSKHRNWNCCICP